MTIPMPLIAVLALWSVYVLIVAWYWQRRAQRAEAGLAKSLVAAGFRKP